MCARARGVGIPREEGQVVTLPGFGCEVNKSTGPFLILFSFPFCSSSCLTASGDTEREWPIIWKNAIAGCGDADNVVSLEVNI